MVKGLAFGVLVCTSGMAFGQATTDQITYASCSVCHGNADTSGSIPAIRGLPYDRLMTSLAGFGAAGDTSTIMHKFVAGFTAAELESLARHVSGLEGGTR
jgi:cytochrome c553